MKANEITIWNSSQERRVPPDYKFVASGNHFRTRTMKRLCQDRKVSVYVRMNTGRRFKQAIGYFVPIDIALLAESLRVKTAAEREERRIKTARFHVKRHEEYVQQFQQEIQKQFPGLPAAEVESIAVRSCEIGSKRVGRTKLLSLEERVRFAVSAHARHNYTDYHEFLRDACDEEEYWEVRRCFAPEVKAILEKWQLGEHEPPSAVDTPEGA